MAPAKQEHNNIVVQIAGNFKGIDIDLPRIKKLIKTVCTDFTRYEIRDTRYEISIAVVDDSQFRKVNKRFLGRNKASDCLSFDLSESSDEKTKTENRKLFELIINGETALKEAARRGHSSEAELALYITHGLLHNLGFDDSTPQQAKKMHDTEDEILQQLGYGLVYNKSKRISNIE